MRFISTDLTIFGLNPQDASTHSSQVAAVLAQLGHEPVLMQAAQALFQVPTQAIANEPITDTIARQAAEVLRLATQMQPLLAAQATAGKDIRQARTQVEQLRRMMLAMATDLRVVLIALASRLVSLRHAAQNNQTPSAGFVEEILHVFSPLANRLGVWQLKWELEDLAFRFAKPQQYAQIAAALEARREVRQALIEQVTQRLTQALLDQDVTAQVYGRPKHIYSIANKMAKKNLPFDGLYDLRAVRVVVDSLRDCYTALGVVHDVYKPIAKEFDDYIARPKPNGYKSLHTVIIADDGKPVEVQIRTQEMHAFAEYGVAAHWKYKEGGKTKASAEEAKIAWLRQLLAWKKDLSSEADWSLKSDEDERIFCLSPQGRVIELPSGATPIDFAYALHTDLGHRCRGAKIDGVMVPLNTMLNTGQTIEIMPDRKLDAGPSRDWLNPNLGYTTSNRSRSKVRAWFNALALDAALVEGRTVVEKELARLGKSATNLQELAQKMGYVDTDALFIAASKADFHSRSIDTALIPSKEETSTDKDQVARARIAAAANKQPHTKPKGDVLVVGVDMLLTQLARCCKPAPPDTIMGYVTRGKGVSIHRKQCASLRHIAQKEPGRLIDCDWGQDTQTAAGQAHYPVDIFLIAADRQGLLRDVSDTFAKYKINITAIHTHSSRGQARMNMTAQVDSIVHLSRALNTVRDIKGVIEINRR